MCGRIGLYAELGDLAAQYRFAPEPIREHYRPCWNIAPTNDVVAIVSQDATRQAYLIRWGFPSRGGRPWFNARSETLAQRPAFSNAFARRRCLTPVNGFYEWPVGNGAGTPVWLHRADEQPFALAAIYNGGTGTAAAIITCEPNSLMAPIHSRMPVMLTPDQYDRWLDPQTGPQTLTEMMAPREWPEFAVRTVSQAVNRTGNDGPRLIAPATAPAPVGRLL